MDINTQAIRRLRDTLLLCDDLLAFNTEQTSRGAEPAHSIEEAVMRRVEHFAETMYLVMMADGTPADVERKTLIGALYVLTDGKVGQAEIDTMLDRFEVNVTRQGTEARLLQIGTRLGGDRSDRETAFTLAAVVAIADDRFELRENRVLEWIKEYFGVADHRMNELLQSL